MPGRGATTEEYKEYMNLIRENNNRADEIRRLKKELAVKSRALELACEHVPFPKSSFKSNDYRVACFTKQAEKEITDEN